MIRNGTSKRFSKRTGNYSSSLVSESFDGWFSINRDFQRNSSHSFIRKKKMVYCVAVTCNNGLRGACISYFWGTPTLFIHFFIDAFFFFHFCLFMLLWSACGSSEVCQLLRHNSSQSHSVKINAYFRIFYREFLRN